MAKYELMLLVDGGLSEEDARGAIANLTDLFNANNCTEQSTIWTNNDQLAYPINKKTTAHRVLVNFTTTDLRAIREFNRLVIINKAVWRHLLINLEHNYAYKTLVNPKKIKIAEFRQEKFQQYLKNKAKLAQQLETAAILDANVVEAKMRKVRDYKNSPSPKAATSRLTKDGDKEKASE